MKLQLVLATAAVLITPAMMPASAQSSNVYVSGGYSRIDTGSSELGALQGRVGVGFGQNFAVEGEGAIGIEEDGVVELDSELGVFAVGKIAVAPSVELFGRVGASRIETNFGEDDGLAYGAGATFNFTGADGIRADWTRHDYDAGEADQYSLSYVRKF